MTGAPPHELKGRTMPYFPTPQIPFLPVIPWDDIHKRWLADCNQRSKDAGYPADSHMPDDYIVGHAILNRTDPVSYMGDTILMLDLHLDDELNNSKVLAIYDCFNNLVLLCTEIDTAWHTIYTNEG